MKRIFQNQRKNQQDSVGLKYFEASRILPRIVYVETF